LTVTRTVVSRRLLAGIAGVAIAALTIAGCSTKTDTNTTPTTSSTPNPYAGLTGDLKFTGATFPAAFYNKALDEFAKVAPDLNLTFTGVGSGQGKKDFGSNLNDFAASDSLVKATDGPAPDSWYYVPTVAAPITVSYNLSGVTGLKLSQATLAKIFGAKITNWNDPAIAADNAGVTLPSKPIVVVHRSDGSGTTNNFTKYLVAVGGTDWTLGTGDTVAWPATTQSAQGNGGVAQLIKSSDGAIGYVDFADAKGAGLVFASIKNKDGQFVAPTVDGATAAIAGATVADDLSYNPLNAPGAAAYPITAPTYLLLHRSYSDAAKGKNVKAFAKWLLTDGQALAAGVNFAKLPDTLQQKALAQVDKVTA
jgi:phosphate transport system substrate-binding protein